MKFSVNDISESEKNRILKQQMTNNIAHELRTPVSSIRGYLETLTACPDMDSKRRNVFIDRAYAQSDGFLHFTYYDTGKGVSEEHLSRIFERFYRVSEGRTRDDGGLKFIFSIKEQ